MKQHGNTESSEGIAVSLHIEAVPYRSAAWRELWRQIFIAVVEELDRVDTEQTEAEAAGNSDGPSGGVGC